MIRRLVIGVLLFAGTRALLKGAGVWAMKRDALTPATVEQAPEQRRYATWAGLEHPAGPARAAGEFPPPMCWDWPRPTCRWLGCPSSGSTRWAAFLELSNSPTGWGWLALVGRGDIAGLLGIAILAGSSVLCLLALVPIYLARGDKAFVAVCLAEVAVVVLAASGWLAGGH